MKLAAIPFSPPCVCASRRDGIFAIQLSEPAVKSGGFTPAAPDRRAHSADRLRVLGHGGRGSRMFPLPPQQHPTNFVAKVAADGFTRY